MTVPALDHLQIAMPKGREDEARAFYHGVLGFQERDKPQNLAGRGGCWFEAGTVKVHLGVDPDFHAATKAHPAFLVRDVHALARKAEAAGHTVKNDEPLDGYDRLFLSDPFGNRIELMQRVP